jgi:hypothetical protein
VALRTHHRKELLRASALAGRRRKSNVKLEFSGTWVSMARTVLRYSVDGERRALRRGNQPWPRAGDVPGEGVPGPLPRRKTSIIATA